MSSTTQKPILQFRTYKDETDMPFIEDLVAVELSEPYSVFTYRYFVNSWPDLTILGFPITEGKENDSTEGKPCVAVVVCKISMDKEGYKRGYIAMLAVHKSYRKRGIASQMVKMALETMRKKGCELCVLETEITNKGALNFYEKLNFVRDKLLQKYYLGGTNAFQLKFWFAPPHLTERQETQKQIIESEKARSELA